jgi:hypothetical protein
LYALLPANFKGEVLTSHGGLTYGGLIMSDKCSAKGVQASFVAINDFLRSIAVRKVVYKAIPWIYHRQPAEEDLFALTSICQARLTIRDISSAIKEAGYNVERRYIYLEKPIKDLGIYQVKLNLHPEVSQTILVNVARSSEEAKKQAKAYNQE